MSSGMPFMDFISLTEPSGPPSPLAPLSETTTMSVSRRVVQEEGLVGRHPLGVHDELEGLVGDVLAEVIPLVALGAASPGDGEALFVIDYVETDRQGIANYRIVPLASSGVMEKGIDISICPAGSRRGA